MSLKCWYPEHVAGQDWTGSTTLGACLNKLRWRESKNTDVAATRVPKNVLQVLALINGFKIMSDVAEGEDGATDLLFAAFYCLTLYLFVTFCNFLQLFALTCKCSLPKRDVKIEQMRVWSLWCDLNKEHLARHPNCFSLPDMSAIQSKELEIPTLNFDSGQLSSKSLPSTYR